MLLAALLSENLSSVKVQNNGELFLVVFIDIAQHATIIVAPLIPLGA
jgi:hypothetical protein